MAVCLSMGRHLNNVEVLLEALEVLLFLAREEINLVKVRGALTTLQHTLTTL